MVNVIKFARTIVIFSMRTIATIKKFMSYRLCVLIVWLFYSLMYFFHSITSIWKLLILIRFSCLHFGQYRRKFLITVSSLTFTLVLLWHTGQITHFISISVFISISYTCSLRFSYVFYSIILSYRFLLSGSWLLVFF